MVKIDDTYCEAFDSLYTAVLVTAKDERWLSFAVNSATGYATSTINCDCEAGLDRMLHADTPDGRVGAIIQFHVPQFKKDAKNLLEWALIHRIGQCVLTCPTASLWNPMDGTELLPVGKKLGFFGDGYQKTEKIAGKDVVVVPTMSGEFLIEENLGVAEGVMGGNLWLMAEDADSALHAAEKAVAAISGVEGVITPFPGGVCGSGSKVGSKYSFLIASTFHSFCPTLTEVVEDTRVPEGVGSVMEIIIDGASESAVRSAMKAAVEAASEVKGLDSISSGNYGGRLGRHKIPLLGL